jgi:processive 1,2-diacylglycerol beta-glucosyltransferase
MWLFRGVDWYFVACEETKVYLSEVGIPPETVFVTGIPIDLVFGQETSQGRIRKTLDLDAGKTTVLISAGGFGVGPVESLVHSVQNVQNDIQVIVICGRNRVLQKRLQKLSALRHKMRVVGYTHEIHTWMAASDLLVGKAGGLTSSEALASGLVLVIVNPVPGQEERNSDHFLEQGVAVRSNNLPALAYKIDSLLSDRKRFVGIQKSVRRLARPHAASDIVSIVMDQREGPG